MLILTVYHHVMCRTKVECRYTSRRVPARGVFPGATVVRGHDWRWSDQDGGPGKEGTVLEISGWQSESSVSVVLHVHATLQPPFLPLFLFFLSQRSVAVVEWKESCQKRRYRLGYKGKVTI